MFRVLVVGWLIDLENEIQNVDYEVRAGLTSVYNDPRKGWVADDVHSESASRTLGYACWSTPLPSVKCSMSLLWM